MEYFWRSFEVILMDQGRGLDLVEAFKYLLWILSSNDIDWLVVVVNLQKTHKK